MMNEFISIGNETFGQWSWMQDLEPQRTLAMRSHDSSDWKNADLRVKSSPGMRKA